MQKDYLPVSEQESGIDDSSYIEKYWTEFWNGFGLEGSLDSTVEKREEYRIMSEYLGKLTPSCRLLDGGCGRGEWVIYFASKGFDVTGLDISQKTILRLKETFSQHSQRFAAGDIRNTKFPADHFEAYFSWGAFEHFEEGLSGCLSEANRILKPGGYIFASVPFQNYYHTLNSRKPLDKSDEFFDRKHGYPKKMRFYQWRFTKQEFERELELNGFEVLKIIPIHKEHGVIRWVKGKIKRKLPAKIRKLLSIILYYLMTRDYIAHMLIAVAVKRRGIK